MYFAAASFCLIVFGLSFEVSSWVSAYRADFRSLVPIVDVTAVTALPSKRSLVLECLACLVVIQKSLITFFVRSFYLSYASELSRQFCKAFLFGFLSHSLIHICPLVVLACGSVSKIFFYISAAVELFEPHFCMLFLLICCLLKDV